MTACSLTPVPPAPLKPQPLFSFITPWPRLNTARRVKLNLQRMSHLTVFSSSPSIPHHLSWFIIHKAGYLKARKLAVDGALSCKSPAWRESRLCQRGCVDAQDRPCSVEADPADPCCRSARSKPWRVCARRRQLCFIRFALSANRKGRPLATSVAAKRGRAAVQPAAAPLPRHRRVRVASHREHAAPFCGVGRIPRVKVDRSNRTLAAIVHPLDPSTTRVRRVARLAVARGA